jgi:hypothetical protein
MSDGVLFQCKRRIEKWREKRIASALDLYQDITSALPQSSVNETKHFSRSFRKSENLQFIVSPYPLVPSVLIGRNPPLPGRNQPV